MLKKFFLVVFAAFFFQNAFAALEYQASQGVYTGIKSGWHLDKASAASELMGLLDAHMATLEITCISGTRAGDKKYGAHITSADPLNPTQWKRYFVSTSLTCSPSSPVLQGSYVISYTSRQYVPPTCDAGQKSTHTFFKGWNTASGGDLDTEVPGSSPDTNYTCDGSCEVIMVDVTSCDTNTEPSSNGYYKQSCSYEFETTGNTCTQSNLPASPDNAPPLPPGVPDPNPNPDGGDPTGNNNPENTGDNGTDPSDPTGEGTGSGGTGSNKDPDACSAAQIAAGTCTGSSGGGGAAPGDRTSDDPATCGGPGQPLCQVDINETGTPDGDAQRDLMESHGDKITDLVKDDGTYWTGVKKYLQKSASELVSLNWSFALPTGCTPFNMGSGYGFSIDMCQYQSVIHDLMSLVWVMATVFGLYRLFVWGID